MSRAGIGYFRTEFLEFWECGTENGIPASKPASQKCMHARTHTKQELPIKTNKREKRKSAEHHHPWRDAGIVAMLSRIWELLMQCMVVISVSCQKV